jgi:membrane protein DedA with SNARE-associated domain
MFDQLVAAMMDYPYLVVGGVFILCGLGLPLPEEIVLLAAGFFCAEHPEHASLPWMMLWCATAILAGDLPPYIGGRVFGVRLLRLRWLRWFVTKQRLASFDRWFRRRGDMVIFIARFLAGLRVVAYFTAGTMKMPWGRFLLLDGLGIVLIVPTLTWLGYRSAGFIKSMIATVQQVERGILWGAFGGGVVVLLWIWVWRHRRSRARQRQPRETFVQPQRPIQRPEEATSAPLHAAPAGTDARVPDGSGPGDPAAGPPAAT